MCGRSRVRRVSRPLPGDLQVSGDPVWVCPLQWVPTVSPDPASSPSHPFIACFTSLLLPSPSAHEHPTQFWSLATTTKILHQMTSMHSLSGFFNTSKTLELPRSSCLLSLHLSSHFFFMYTSMAQTHLHIATTSSKLFGVFFLPLTEQCTNNWEGFSHGRRCFTNTWFDKHCTPTANARPVFIGNHRGVALSLPHTPTHTYPHLHTSTMIDPGACYCLYLVPNTFAIPLISNKN